MSTERCCCAIWSTTSLGSPLEGRLLSPLHAHSQLLTGRDTTAGNAEKLCILASEVSMFVKRAALSGHHVEFEKLHWTMLHFGASLCQSCILLDCNTYLKVGIFTRTKGSWVPRFFEKSTLRVQSKQLCDTWPLSIGLGNFSLSDWEGEVTEAQKEDALKYIFSRLWLNLPACGHNVHM